MSHRRVVPAALALVAAGPLLVPANAAAAPPNIAPLGAYVCSDGRTIDVSGVDRMRFPEQVAFVDGKGLVARWFATSAQGTVTILDGPHAGQVLSFDLTASGPANRHRTASSVDLTGLAPCVLSGHEAYTFSLPPEAAEQLGLDGSYVGTAANVDQTITQTAWFNPVQLSKR